MHKNRVDKRGMALIYTNNNKEALSVEEGEETERRTIDGSEGEGKKRDYARPIAQVIAVRVGQCEGLNKVPPCAYSPIYHTRMYG